MENLLNALGALYILNIYYKNEAYWYETPIRDRKEFNINDSIIFSPQVCDATHISMSIEMGDSENKEIKKSSLDEAIYIIKFREDAFREIHKSMCKDNIRAVLTIKSSKEYLEYINRHPEEKNANIMDVARKIGKDPIMFITKGEFAKTFNIVYNHKEVVLNKHHNIYPDLKYEEYLAENSTKEEVRKIVQQ